MSFQSLFPKLKSKLILPPSLAWIFIYSFPPLCIPILALSLSLLATERARDRKKMCTDMSSFHVMFVSVHSECKINKLHTDGKTINPQNPVQSFIISLLLHINVHPHIQPTSYQYYETITCFEWTVLRSPYWIGNKNIRAPKTQIFSMIRIIWSRLFSLFTLAHLQSKWDNTKNQIQTPTKEQQHFFLSLWFGYAPVIKSCMWSFLLLFSFFPGVFPLLPYHAKHGSNVWMEYRFFGTW